MQVNFMEAVHPETLVDLVEYDRMADFIETIRDFPDSDWSYAYHHYRYLMEQGTGLHDQWKYVFQYLRNGKSFTMLKNT